MRRSRGFTLIELSIALAVVAIALSLAVPSLTQARYSNEVSHAQSSLFTALTAARVDAITRGTEVTVCASSNGQDCDGNWSGWLVFEGASATTGITQPLSAGLLGDVQIFAAPNSLTFSNLGTVAGGSSWIICDAQSQKRRAVAVNLLGRALASKDFDGDGQHDSPLDAGGLLCQ